LLLIVYALLPAYMFAALARALTGKELRLVVDFLFVLIVLVTPYLLMLFPCSNFSAGISEGETIKNCVRTELGWRVQMAESFQSIWQMVFYLAMSVLVQSRLARRT
jgi:hypothetical protein